MSFTYGQGLDGKSLLRDVLTDLENPRFSDYSQDDINALIYSRLLELKNRLAPKPNKSDSQERVTNLLAEIKSMKEIPAIRYIRGKMGWTLRESKDFYDAHVSKL